MNSDCVHKGINTTVAIVALVIAMYSCHQTKKLEGHKAFLKCIDSFDSTVSSRKKKLDRAIDETGYYIIGRVSKLKPLEVLQELIDYQLKVISLHKSFECSDDEWNPEVELERLKKVKTSLIESKPSKVRINNLSLIRNFQEVTKVYRNCCLKQYD